ncbi:hypothetical protein D5086_002561 [Populus alba]|uniref:Uncharacterized protein n=1 Tax=Populus alba TaxID=43335 RepID=A0ACC4D457_POPAL
MKLFSSDRTYDTWTIQYVKLRTTRHSQLWDTDSRNIAITRVVSIREKEDDKRRGSSFNLSGCERVVGCAIKAMRKFAQLLQMGHWLVCLPIPHRALQTVPVIYVTSLAAVEVLRARDGGQQIIDYVDVIYGLNLGEYTALSLQEAADTTKSAMVSVIGLDSDKVQQLCDAANQDVDEDNKVQIANYLCPIRFLQICGNYVVYGGVMGVEAVEAKAKSFKARMTVRLVVVGAFHTSFMEPAVSRLESALAAIEIRQPRIPVISNIDAQSHADPATIKKILARQVTSHVQWETTVKTLLAKGLKKSYELGPGKVIAGIVKRMDKKAEMENIGA